MEKINIQKGEFNKIFQTQTMCSIIKKFLSESTKNSKTNTVSALFYAKEGKGMYMNDKLVAQFGIHSEVSCNEFDDRVDLKFSGWNDGTLVDVAVSLPKKENSPFKYAHASDTCIYTFVDYFNFVTKQQRKTLELFTCDKTRTNGDDGFADFRLEYHEPTWTMRQELENEIKNGQHDTSWLPEKLKK